MMKARKILIGAVVLTGIITSGHAQQAVSTPGAPDSSPMGDFEQPSTDVYKKETIVPEKKPVPYPYVREADVMWAKDIWRTIDLRQRMNFPLRYPISGEMSGGDRYSLFGLLMKGIETEELTPYEYIPNVGWKDPFKKPTTLPAIYKSMRADSLRNDDGTVDMDVRFDRVERFIIQEQWFFDKKHSVMDVRIIAMAPVFMENLDEENNLLAQPRPIIPFIVHFPQCRRLFATNSIYNAQNDAQPISFDDLFFLRKFSSTIITESNVYGNRPLSTYKTGQDILLEAEKIKNELFLMEHDLWEY